MSNERTVKVINATNHINEEELKIRVAAYCRVSTDSDDQENSFLAQVGYYNNYIVSQPNMILVDIYADEGITGTCMNKREEFKRLIHDASLGRIDRVLCKSVSRFARNSLECIESIRALKEYGVNVVFENDNIDTRTMNSEMILYVKSAFAQSEALAGSVRVSTAMRMKMENGTYTTSNAPYGFKLVNGNLEIIQEEAKVVKRIFDMYISGKGINAISATLNRESIVGDGKRWNNTTVRYILTNEKYIGDSITQKTYTPQMLPLRNRPNKGQLDKYYIANTHTAIISKETFELAKQMLIEQCCSGFQQRKQHLFSQMIECCNCGWSYRRKVQRGKVYWACSRKNNSGYECNGKQYMEDDVKFAFVRMFNKLRCFEKEIIDITLNQLVELRNKQTQGDSEIKEIDEEIKRLSEQNSRYEKFRAKKIMDEISFREQYDRLRGRLSELRSRRKKLIQNNDEEATIENIRQLKDMLQDLPQAMLDFDADVFASIVSKIRTEDDGSLSFILKGDLKLTEKMTGDT